MVSVEHVVSHAWNMLGLARRDLGAGVRVGANGFCVNPCEENEMKWLGRGTMVVVSTFLAVAALDRVVAWFDFGYTPSRGRPNEHRRLEKAEFSVDVRLNALGFRESRLPSPKPPGTLRIVALGDSFTQGFGVEERQAWPRRLEGLLDAQDARPHEVVNLGVAGANPRDYLDHLRDPGLAYEPDVVLVMVMANDVENRWVQLEFDVQIASQVLANARRAVLAPPPSWTRIPKAVFPALYTLVWKRLHALGADARRTEAGGRRAERTNAAPAPSPPSATAEAVLLKLADCYQRREFIEHFLTTVPPGRLDGLRPVLEGTVPPDADATEPYLRVKALVDPRLLADLVLLPPRYDAAWDDVARQLRRIVALARWERARPVLIFAPAAHQVTAAGRPYLESLGFAWDERTLTDTTFADRLRAFARSENVLFVDLLPVLREHRDEGLYFPRDGHWTPAGHALAAAEIARALATPDTRAMSSRNRGGRTR